MCLCKGAGDPRDLHVLTHAFPTRRPSDVGQRNRRIEYLPDDEEVLDRLRRGDGLTRAEIAVLLSYSKLVLYEQLLESNLPDDPYFAADLARYFPTPLRQPYDAQINRHRLKRENIVTVVSNGLINRFGINFVHGVNRKGVV